MDGQKSESPPLTPPPKKNNKLFFYYRSKQQKQHNNKQRRTETEWCIFDFQLNVFLCCFLLNSLLQPIEIEQGSNIKGKN